MKKRVGAFLLAFTLALTSIVSYAEEESFAETVAELSFTEEMSEQETAENIMLEEALPEEDAETWIEETAAPEEETQKETPMEEVPVMEETEKQEIEEDAESETEPWDGFFTNDHPEKGGILIADIPGADGRKLTLEIPENAFTEKVTLEIRDEIINPGSLESGLLGSDDASVLQKVLAKADEGIDAEYIPYNFYMLSLTFYNEAQAKVQPNGEITVTADLSGNPADLLGDAKGEILTENIYHINEYTDAAETVWSSISLTDQKQVQSFVFAANSFTSPFVLFMTGPAEQEEETEPEEWDGYFSIENPELGGIMTAEIAGGLGGTVTAEVPEGAFTEMVTLKAEAAVYAPEDADADILEAVLAAAGKTEEDNIYGLYVIDICFINGDGEEVEPALPVSIAVDTSKAPVDVDANEADTESIDKTIFHINEGTGEAEPVGNIVALNDENQVTGMAFDSEEFSPFVLLLSGEDDSEFEGIYEDYLDIDSSTLPDNEELIEGYIEQVFDLSNIATIANHGEKYLSGTGLAIYEYLKTAFEEIAAGERSATSFDLSGFSFTWTYEELDLDASTDTSEVSEVARAKLKEEMDAVIAYLLVDCPYDLYWYDKTASTSYWYSTSYDLGNSVTMKIVSIFFPVISTYQVSGYDSSNPMVDTTKTSVPTNAAANAQTIVDKYATLDSKERMEAYRDEICDLVSYNSDAASPSYAGGYGDPWQLVYVFDGDSSTNVVCEGYSKAFQYLCDLDGGNELCYLVTGIMSGGTGDGAHMWNIVRLDGTNYLVDVTNSDTGTVGAGGGLFLVTDDDAIVSDYPMYTFKPSTREISYTYDEDTLSTFPTSVLTLGKATATKSLSEYDIALSPEEYTYDGTAKEPSVTVTHEGTTLVLDEDYRVSYSDNINAGTATVTITGIGDYTGEEVAMFAINPADISSADLKLSKTEYTYDGEEKKPTVTVTYDGADLEEGTNYTVSYIDNINAGKAIVSVTGIGNYEGTLSSEFTIDKAEQTITAEIAEDMIAYGETTSISAEADFTNQISYESSDTSVATVDENGVVTAVGTGEAAITVTAEGTDNYNDASTTVNIKVVKASQVVTAEIYAETIAYKETATITAESTGTGNLVYSSDNISVATVDENGIVTAVGIGTATITVTAEENDNYESGYTTVSITVEKADQTITAEIASKSIVYGDKTEITASSSGSGRITYSSSDETVAMVSEDGTVTAVEPGTAVITVTAEEDDYYKAASVELEITVTKALQDLTVVVDSDSDTIKFGETIHINAYSSGTGTITYSSSDESVATVDENGDVKGIAPGEVMITVTAEENEDYESASQDIILTVVKADQTIEAVITSQTLEYKETATITVEEWIGTISYVSNDESVATVDENGVVTAVGAGEAVITITASGNDYYNEDSVTFEITVEPLDVEKADSTIDLSEDSYTYNGEAKKPEATVTVNGEILTEGIDYTVSYEDNVNAGTATVTVEGIGNYSGTLTEKFEIAKADLNDASISLSKTSYTYDGTEKTPDVVVTLSDGTVLNSSEYTVEYENNVDAGTATVTISGGDNFINTASAEFTIEQADIAGATVTLSEDSFTYDGTEKMPEITITMSNGTILEPDTDYKISFSEDVVNAGTVEVTIVGIGNYTGTLACAYTIEKATQDISFETTEISKLENAHPFTNELTVASISEEDGAGITYASSDPSIADVDEISGEVVIDGTGTVTITATAAETRNYAEATVSYELTITRPEGTITSNIGDGEHVYDGETIYLMAEISHDSAGDADDIKYTYQWYKGDVLLEGETGETLELSGEDVNVQEGTVYTCVITMESKTHFKDTVEPSFTVTILKADNSLTFITEDLNKTYDGIAMEEPEIAAYFGADTAVFSWYELDEDGEVIGEALDAAPIDAGMYKVVASIEGTDNYVDATAELVFTIEPKGITEDMFTIDTEAVTYNGSAVTKEILSNLMEGIDYIVSYEDNTDAGTATITITGMGNYCGEVTESFTIVPASIKEATVGISDASYTYDGTEKTPEITVTMPDGTVLVQDTDYEVSYDDNVSAGTVSVTITGIGNYTDEIEDAGTFEIDKADIEDATVELSKDSYVYDGTAKAPEVTVTLPDGTVLVFGTDYEVSYTDNINVGEVIVTITGIGNYDGTINASFVITEPESETAGGSGTGSQGTDTDGGSDGNTSNETEASTEQGTGASTEQETEASTEDETEDQQAESVKTSDETPVMPVTMLFLAAGVCFLLLLRQRREREER